MQLTCADDGSVNVYVFVIAVAEFTVILWHFALCVINGTLAPSSSHIILTKSHFA